MGDDLEAFFGETLSQVLLRILLTSFLEICLGFRGLGFRGAGFRGLGFRGLGFRGLGA